MLGADLVEEGKVAEVEEGVAHAPDFAPAGTPFRRAGH